MHNTIDSVLYHAYAQLERDLKKNARLTLCSRFEEK